MNSQTRDDLQLKTTHTAQTGLRARNTSSVVFVIAWIAYASLYFCRRNIAWTPVHTTALHSSLSSYATLLVIFSTGYVAGLFVSGWTVDRYSARLSLAIAGVVSALSTLLLMPQLPTPAIFALELANGIGQGFGWPAITKLFAVWFDRRERAVVMAWWSSSYALGGVLAAQLAILLSTKERFIDSGIRLSMAVPAALLLIATIYCYVRLNIREKPVNIQARLEAKDSATDFGWKFIVRNRELRLIATAYFFLKMTRYALIFWLPLYFLESLHTSKIGALNTALIPELTGFVGALGAAYVSDKLFAGRRYIVSSSMMFILAFVLLLHPLIRHPSSSLMIFSLVTVGALVYGVDLMLSGITLLDAVPAQYAGRAAGFVDGIGSIGQILAPLLVPVCLKYLGWSGVFNVFVLSSIISAGLLMTRWDRDRTA